MMQSNPITWTCTFLLILYGFCECYYEQLYIPYESPFLRTHRRRIHPFHPIRDHSLSTFIGTSAPAYSEQIEPSELKTTTETLKLTSTMNSIEKQQPTAPHSNIQSNNAADDEIKKNHIFESYSFWNASDKPVMANGHVGYIPFGDSIYMNGLYNGYTERSHRARIPNYANIQFDPCSWSEFMTSDLNKLHICLYALDTFDGIFRSQANFNDEQFTVEQIQYAHRYYEMAIVNRIRLQRNQIEKNPNEGFKIRLSQQIVSNSEDLTITKTNSINILNRTVILLEASTTTIEDPAYQTVFSNVSILYEQVPEMIELLPHQNFADYTFITIIQSNSSGIEGIFQHLHEIESELLESHVNGWHQFWQEKEIFVEGDDELSKVIHASLYAIASSLPSLNTSQPRSTYYGLSPSGLLNQNYHGHSFWDTETWMHPPVLLLEPRWSQELLNYRYLMRKAAYDNAINTGYKGYRYAWESAFTGRDVTPGNPQIVDHEIHITADIAHALRQHFLATYDFNWFRNIGCDLAYGTAQFWENRVSFNASTNRYDINGVMGPDEDHDNINNNAFTNVAAALNLYFASFASCFCNKLDPVKYPLNTNWSSIAKRITLLYDRQLDYNPQYDGYNLSVTIKQADAVLLGYPLYYSNIQASTRRNNLKLYTNVTRANGPAMTWSMHMIGFLEVDTASATEQMFHRTYLPYVRKPFFVWNENADGVENGASNFITGAGGFLQLIIYGYAGIHINVDSLTIEKPLLPPNTTKLKLNDIWYKRTHLAITITQNDVRVSINGERDIHIFLDGIEQEANVNNIVFNQYQILMLKPHKSPFMESCSLPADTIDPFIIN